MTDHELALGLSDARRLEQAASLHWQACEVNDLAEKDASLIMRRHATALRKSIEMWIGTRAMRAALK